MKKAFNNHMYALKVTLSTLSQGKLFIYFIPAFVVALIYLFFTGWTRYLSSAGDAVENVWLIGGAVSSVIKGTFWFVDFVLLQFFKFFVLVLLSPFNGLLAEKFDNQLTGNTFDGGVVRMLNDLLRAVLIALLALTLELFLLVIWWLLSWIIPFDILDTIVPFLISSFFFGFAFYDYGLERYGEGTFASLGFAFSNMLHMIFTGAFFTLVFMIPVAGIILAPLLTTMLSTATYLKLRGAQLPPASF